MLKEDTEYLSILTQMTNTKTSSSKITGRNNLRQKKIK